MSRLGSTAGIEEIRRAWRQLSAETEATKQYKADRRDVTLTRDEPTGADDIQAGDRLGDYWNGTAAHYSLVMIPSGDWKWAVLTQDTAWP